jgi:hypothetical protein
MNVEHLKIIYEQLPKENQKPLNQLAKRALKTLKVSPDPNSLYLLQLIEWALSTGRIEVVTVPKSRASFLLNTLEAMITWRPKNVMQVFSKNDDGDQVVIYPPGPVDPVRLAEEAIEQLHSRLIAAGAYPDQD